MINHNIILEDGTPSTLASVIDNRILPYTSEEVLTNNETVNSIIYTPEENEEYYFSLCTEYKIDDKMYSKEKGEIILFLNKAIIGAEYEAAFYKARFHNFTDNVDLQANNLPIKNDDVVEISIIDAFNYGYLRPFMLFIQNRFIFWSCITFIHSISGNYLRIIDNNGRTTTDKNNVTSVVPLFTNPKWTKTYEITVGSFDERTYKIIRSEEDPYYIDDTDVTMITLPVDVSYTDDICYYDNSVINNVELMFNRDGYMVPADNTKAGTFAYLAATGKDEYIRVSWNSEDTISISDYINKGKKIYFEDLIVFKNVEDDTYELYAGNEDGEFNTTEELIEQMENGFQYILIASNKLMFPISLKDEFITPENITDDQFNEVLSIPVERQDTYTEVTEDVLAYNRNLLRSCNKDVVSEIFTLTDERISSIKANNNILSMLRYKADEYETFVMIFCDGLLIENYNTIEYTLDSFTIEFTDELYEEYANKELEIVYFKRINNSYARYEKVTNTTETMYGYELTSETDAQNLRLFVPRSREESFPDIKHTELTQYELDYDLNVVDITYNLFEIIDGEKVTVDSETVPTNFAKLKSEYYYIKPVTFVSARQFRYNCVVFTDSIDEFRFEFDKNFKYCRDMHNFMVFYNGVLVTRDKYYLVFPDSSTPFNSSSIYLKFRCEQGSRLEIFYVPNRLYELSEEEYELEPSTHSYNISGETAVIKYTAEDDLIFPLADDLCFIFRDGRKIPINKMYNLGAKRICLADYYSSGCQFTIYRHSYDVNEEYLETLNSGECLYETLLDSYDEDSDGSALYTDGGFYTSGTIYTVEDTEDIMDDCDAIIFNRVIVDYYMQEGTHLDRGSIPLKIEVWGDPLVNEHGIYVLYPEKSLQD